MNALANLTRHENTPDGFLLASVADDPFGDELASTRQVVQWLRITQRTLYMWVDLELVVPHVMGVRLGSPHKFSRANRDTLRKICAHRARGWTALEVFNVHNGLMTADEADEASRQRATALQDLARQTLRILERPHGY